MTVDVTNYQVNDGTFDVIIKDIKSLSGEKQIRVPVWCERIRMIYIGMQQRNRAMEHIR